MSIEEAIKSVRDGFMQQVESTLYMLEDPDPRMVGLLQEPEVIKLPAYPNPTDDSDWCMCPYCGERNHYENAKCSFCNGRLGRPLMW
jgi:hypothetical protein